MIAARGCPSTNSGNWTIPRAPRTRETVREPKREPSAAERTAGGSRFAVIRNRSLRCGKSVDTLRSVLQLAQLDRIQSLQLKRRGRTRSRKPIRAPALPRAVSPVQTSSYTTPPCCSTPFCDPTCRRYHSWRSGAFRLSTAHSSRARSPSGQPSSTCTGWPTTEHSRWDYKSVETTRISGKPAGAAVQVLHLKRRIYRHAIANTGVTVVRSRVEPQNGGVWASSHNCLKVASELLSRPCGIRRCASDCIRLGGVLPNAATADQGRGRPLAGKAP